MIVYKIRTTIGINVPFLFVECAIKCSDFSVFLRGAKLSLGAIPRWLKCVQQTAQSWYQDLISVFLTMAEGKDELLNPDPLKENEFALWGLEIN